MKHRNPNEHQTRNAVNNAENEALNDYVVNRKIKREQQRNISKLKDQQRQQSERLR